MSSSDHVSINLIIVVSFAFTCAKGLSTVSNECGTLQILGSATLRHNVTFLFTPGDSQGHDDITVTWFHKQHLWDELLNNTRYTMFRNGEGFVLVLLNSNKEDNGSLYNVYASTDCYSGDIMLNLEGGEGGIVSTATSLPTTLKSWETSDSITTTPRWGTHTSTESNTTTARNSSTKPIVTTTYFRTEQVNTTSVTQTAFENHQTDNNERSEGVGDGLLGSKKMSSASSAERTVIHVPFPLKLISIFLPGLRLLTTNNGDEGYKCGFM